MHTPGAAFLHHPRHTDSVANLSVTRTQCDPAVGGCGPDQVRPWRHCRLRGRRSAPHAPVTGVCVPLSSLLCCAKSALTRERKGRLSVRMHASRREANKRVRPLRTRACPRERQESSCQSPDFGPCHQAGNIVSAVLGLTGAYMLYYGDETYGYAGGLMVGVFTSASWVATFAAVFKCAGVCVAECASAKETRSDVKRRVSQLCASSAKHRVALSPRGGQLTCFKTVRMHTGVKGRMLFLAQLAYVFLEFTTVCVSQWLQGAFQPPMVCACEPGACCSEVMRCCYTRPAGVEHCVHVP